MIQILDKIQPLSKISKVFYLQVSKSRKKKKKAVSRFLFSILTQRDNRHGS